MPTPDSDDIAAQAALLIEMGRDQEAGDLLSSGLRSDPENPRLLGSMGIANLNMGNRKEARDFLSAALHFAPDNSHYTSCLALATFKEDGLKARALARRAVELAPHSPKAHATAARVAFSLDVDSREATASIEKAKELDPTNPDLWVLSGRFLEFRHRRRSAHRDYLEALRLQPENGDALLGVARTEKSPIARMATARSAGRTLLGDSRPIGELERGAKFHLLGAASIYAVPPSILMVALLSKVTSPHRAVMGGFLFWLACLLVVPRAGGEWLSRRWARGSATWWLFDSSLAQGIPKRLPRLRRVLWVLAILVVLCLALVLSISVSGMPSEKPVQVPVNPRMVLSDEPYEIVLPDNSRTYRRVMIPEDEPPTSDFAVILADGTEARAQVKPDQSEGELEMLVMIVLSIGIVSLLSWRDRRRSRRIFA